MVEKLALPTQTLYAELMEQLMALEAHRSIGRLSGCFITKSIKGENYYYYQYSDLGGVLRQIYVGKKNSVLENVVQKFLKEREAFKSDLKHTQRLCAQLRAGGAMTTDATSARVLKALAEGGVFFLNGVLVGTHAFIVLGNLLGVRWRETTGKTDDVDIATDPILHIALPPLQANVPQILESLELGFLPVPSLNPKHPSSSFKVRGKPLRVDLITPETKRAQRGPVFIPRFNVAAHPLRYLDYLIENPEKGVVINGNGILVNVPSPARFAFHKLIASQERSVAMHSKKEKDVLQATQLFSILADERPGDLILSWEELIRRGKGWIQKTRTGLSLVQKKNPSVFQKINEVLNLKGKT